MTKENEVEVKTVPAPTVDKLLADLFRGQAINTAFRNKFLEEYKIDGKTLNEWRTIFAIEMPLDLDAIRCKEVGLQILQKLESAFFYLVSTEAVLTALENGMESDKNVRLEALISGYRKRAGKEPPGSMLPEFRKQADNEGTTMGSTVANARISRDFFNTIIKHLTSCRKIVDVASIANGTIARAERVYS